MLLYKRYFKCLFLELCQKAKSHDDKLEAKILPLLDEIETSQKEIEQRLDQFQNCIQEW